MAFFFLFLLHVAWVHQIRGGGPRGAPSVEAYCPFGGVENFYHFLTTGGFMRHIEPSTMILLGAVLLLTLLVSRGFCGWICPFGSLQEWIGMLGRKVLKKKFNPTGSWDQALRYLKYVILVVIIAFTWRLGMLVFRPYDPFLAFFHLGQNLDEMPWAYAALGAVLVGSFFIDRFFCKYACPLGAVLGVLGKAGLTKVVREPEGCKGCHVCQQKCFAYVDFLAVERIRDAECNHCLECVINCPKPNVLSAKGPGWRFSHPVYAGVLVVGLFGMVGVSRLTGQWQTKPQRVSFEGATGKLDAGNIRGWMTVNDVASGYRIPLPELYRRSGLPATVLADTRLNQIGKNTKLAFEPDKLRDVVRAYLEGAPPPASGPAAITERHAEAGAPAEHPGGEEQVKGYMTLNEIQMETGVRVSYIRRALALPETVNPRVPLRDWMHDQGTSVADVRAAVKDYQAGKR